MTTFEEWETEHYNDLLTEYRDYLRSVVAEWDDADMTDVEDFATWAREEYELWKQHAQESS